MWSLATEFKAKVKENWEKKNQRNQNVPGGRKAEQIENSIEAAEYG